MLNREKKSILAEIDRLAANCQFYKGTGDQIHFINEAGALRGAMNIADKMHLTYLRWEFYDNYIKPAHDMMNQG